MPARKPIQYFIDENGCHVCTSHRKRKYGYIEVQRDGKHTDLHRLLYEQKFGDLPSNVVLRHTCDNPSCINIGHLIPGTHVDNVQDRVERNRSAAGVNNGRSKLNPEKVLEILKCPELSPKDLGKRYNVDPNVIRKIRKGLIWKDVKLE